MASITEFAKKHCALPKADLDWLNLLINEWQLLADLASADLVLWLPTKTPGFIAAAHARPSSAVTIFYRDISGQQPKKEWLGAMQEAFETGNIVELKALDQLEGVPTRFSAVPVRGKLNSKSDAVKDTPIAVITRHTDLSDIKTPNRLQLSSLACAVDLFQMIAAGNFPDPNSPSGPRRGAPRANDGLLRLDEEGLVSFASPNALSVFNRFGVTGELEGHSLIERITNHLNQQGTVDEGLPLVLSGRASWRADLEAEGMTISIRAIPVKKDGKRTGAIVLCRDVTELRERERELITKDATIREIHHRVKNNLQTVASLLRIQARRSDSTEVKESLNQAMRRVSAIALVHDTLSEGLNQELDFDAVFERILSLVGELAASHNTTVRTLIDGKFGQVPSSIATPLAVALTELVTNAVEHGLRDRSGVVHVEVERQGRRLSIVISDNGAGLPGGELPTTGLGTQIIRTLLEGELRGAIRWSNQPEGGTRVVITLQV